MDDLTRTVLDYVMSEGACSAGIATVETLAGGPPSTDLTYAMPEAKSAISFAVPLNQAVIGPYLSKEDRLSHERNNLHTNSLVTGIATALAHFLNHRGFKSKGLLANEVYRDDVPGGQLAMMPDISLRYLAVRSGAGFFGLSGNVLTKDAGAAVILGATLTAAELTPGEPVPPEENYCDRCGLCLQSCASGMMDPDEETTVILGDLPFTYAKRRNYLRCEFVCGGMSGLHPSGKWSTWSPGRFLLPEEDGEFLELMRKGMRAYNRRPAMSGGHYQVLMKTKLFLTCGNCQLLCCPDLNERKKRFKMLTSNGVVIQHPDGAIERVSPGKAEQHMAAMNPESQALYT